MKTYVTCRLGLEPIEDSKREITYASFKFVDDVIVPLLPKRFRDDPRSIVQIRIEAITLPDEA